jgi:hypothetical protein
MTAWLAPATPLQDRVYMHPFPPEDDLRFLVGKEIGQIALDPWSVQFRFADQGRITVEGKFEHVDVKGEEHLHHDGEYRDVGPVFLRELVQQVITGVQAEPYCLSLTFDNGSVLRIHSEDGPYEDGQIYRSDAPNDLIVF